MDRFLKGQDHAREVAVCLGGLFTCAVLWSTLYQVEKDIEGPVVLSELKVSAPNRHLQTIVRADFGNGTVLDITDIENPDKPEYGEFLKEHFTRMASDDIPLYKATYKTSAYSLWDPGLSAGQIKTATSFERILD